MKVRINFFSFDLLNASHVKMLGQFMGQSDDFIVGLRLYSFTNQREKKEIRIR